jgi:hypothetical protein
MKVRGTSLVITALLLACVSCTEDTTGSPAAGTSKTSKPSTSKEEPAPNLPEDEVCDGCSPEVEAAVDNPVVAVTKLVDDPPDCEKILPAHTVEDIVGAPVERWLADEPTMCGWQFTFDDGSYDNGNISLYFQSPHSLGATLADFNGNTAFEAHDGGVGLHAIALNAAIGRYEYGGWMEMTVTTTKDATALDVAHELSSAAFDNLADG